MITKEQFGGIVRALLAAVSGYFIGKGVGDAGLWEAVSGGVALILTGLWSWKVKT